MNCSSSKYFRANQERFLFDLVSAKAGKSVYSEMGSMLNFVSLAAILNFKVVGSSCKRQFQGRGSTAFYAFASVQSKGVMQ